MSGSEYKRHKATLKSKLTRFKTFVDKLTSAGISDSVLDERQVLELKRRIEQVTPILSEFEKCEDSLNSLCLEEEVDEKELETFENTYFECISMSEMLLKKVDTSLVRSDSRESLNSCCSNPSEHGTRYHKASVRLPTIELPTFAGEPTTWLAFRDMFQTLIDENKELSDVQKFSYLRAALSGKARDMIASLSLTHANYSIAWNSLKERFDNSRSLINSHIREILELPTIKQENSGNFRSTIDSLRKNLRALDSLVQPDKQYEAFLMYVLQSKLDSATNRDFESNNASTPTSFPSLEDLFSFVERRATVMETVELRPKEAAPNPRGRARSFPTTMAPLSRRPSICAFCKDPHNVSSCPKFRELDVKGRQLKTKQLNLCYNCLAFGHSIKNCRSKFTCFHCKGKHHSLLHIDKPAQPAGEPHSTDSSIPTNISAFSSHIGSGLLPTASVIVYDSQNRPHQVKVLLDSGSMSSFISAGLLKRLGLPEKPAHLQVKGITPSSIPISSTSAVTIHSTNSSFHMNISCLVIPKIISKLPTSLISAEEWKIPEELTLADPAFYFPSNVEILLGASHFWDILLPGKVSIGKDKPTLTNSRFGWIVSGAIPFVDSSSHNYFCKFAEPTINEALSKFWQLEEVPSPFVTLSQEEFDCESHFASNVQRNKDGRFVVSIPFKEGLDQLGDSYNQAQRRFLNLEKRLIFNPSLYKRYCDFMQEYEECTHMSPVAVPEPSRDSYFLPHHGVLKEESLTTKLRVVFDGSAKSASGVSLNDLQMVGPVIQSDLFNIIIRFRKHKYVFSSDIKSMYRQVLVAERHRRFQRIVWRTSPELPLKIYDLNTVTYGTASASFLATRCLKQIGLDCQDTQPVTSKVIMEDFYVDDCLSGCDSLREAQELCSSLAQVLDRYGFPLRKWLANDAQVLNGVAPSDFHPNHLSLGSNSKTLGLLWANRADTLLFSISKGTPKQATKRVILSDVSQIFDPLGLLSPCIMLGKILLQTLWLEKLTWDDPLPPRLSKEWSVFREALSTLNSVSFPRKVLCDFPKSIAVHGFCDASTKGYGACVYVRSTSQEGHIECHLLCSKGKVAPLKPVSIPRLELCGALVLVKLVSQIIPALQLNIDEIVLWTDSTIVLSWLKIPANRLQTFVANRVVQIQEASTNAVWRHVPTQDNPADLVSRGAMPSHLLESEMWSHGPAWLSLSNSEWPTSKFDAAQIPELRPSTVVSASISTEPSIFERFSSLTRLKRVVAYCLRLRSNCQRSSCDRILGPLTASELNQAMISIIKISQTESFPEVLKDLGSGRSLNSSRLLSLSPYLAQDGLIRVGGRIKHSAYPVYKKHPSIINGSHPLASLIVSYEHLRLLHAGPQQMLFCLRESYWITSGRALCKRVVRSCVRCFKCKPKMLEPIMGQLPISRLQPSFPFQNTGTDYAGPFLLKDRRGRGSKTSKAYVCLFVCLVTKAVHLELVSELTSEAFLQSLRRFVARRGKPTNVYSDNGRNYVGANALLKELTSFFNQTAKDLSNFAAEIGIQWHFIPSLSPHFGGLWEAAVKGTKHHLKRVLGDTKLTYEDYATVLTQIETILNSRPLSPLSTDPSDLEPLTPGHFLLGRNPTAVPSEDTSAVPVSRLSRFQHLQQLVQHFWTRWSLEYISTLQERSKWRRANKNVAIDALVLIKDNNLPPLKWRLGRVVAVHPGVDRVVRVVSVRTSTGIIRRSVASISPLPETDTSA